MNLDAGNTAIVVDSTADFPEAPERFPNWRVVPLYVLFGDESHKDYVELGPQDFYARLRTAPELPDHLAADARRLPRRLRGAGRLRADPLAAHLGPPLRDCRERTHRGGDARRRSRARDRLGHRLGGDRAARARDPAPAGAGHDRRGDRRAPRALPERARAPLHRRHARVPRQRRAHRSCRCNGRPAPEREADPHDHRRRGRPAEARSRQPEGDARVRRPFHRRHPRIRRSCGSGSRTPMRRSGPSSS